MPNLLKSLPLKQLSKLFYFLPLLFLANCEKEPSLDGESSGDKLERVDSLQVVAYTESGTPRDALNEGDVVLGKLTDPRFGESVASFYTQLRLTTNSFIPGANPILDSAFLEIRIESVFGPLDIPLDIEIYELTEEIALTSSYNSNTDLAVGSTLLGSLNGFVYNNETFLRIPITTAFYNDLFSQFGTTTTVSNDNFQDYLQGLYVTINPTSGGDGLIDLDLPSELSLLNLYFRTDNAIDSVYSFVMDVQALKVNNYKHDVAGSELSAALNDVTNNDESILLGGLSLSNGIVELPDLTFLQGSIINQARLTFYQTDFSAPENTNYAIPEFLLLTGGKDNDTVQYFLSDYVANDPSSYGGVPELTNVNSNPTYAYSYQLPRFIQRVVNQETDISYLNIEVLNFNNGNRIKLGGGNHPTFPVTLEILYTKP